MSGSVAAATDEIPVIFVRKFSVVPTPAASDTSCSCKFKMADGNRNRYKLMTGRDVNVMSAGHSFRACPIHSTGTDIVRLRRTASGTKLQTGSRNCTPNRKY